MLGQLGRCRIARGITRRHHKHYATSTADGSRPTSTTRLTRRIAVASFGGWNGELPSWNPLRVVRLSALRYKPCGMLLASRKHIGHSLPKHPDAVYKSFPMENPFLWTSFVGQPSTHWTPRALANQSPRRILAASSGERVRHNAHTTATCTCACHCILHHVVAIMASRSRLTLHSGSF